MSFISHFQCQRHIPAHQRATWYTWMDTSIRSELEICLIYRYALATTGS